MDCVERRGHRNLEIILIDDGSNDNSLSICEKFALQDKLFDSKCCVLGFISPLERVQRVCEAG